MRNFSDFFPDDAWLEVATDAEELVRELVEDRGQVFGELKLRFVRLKLGHLKLRLSRLKQCLQQQIEYFESRLQKNYDDDEARGLLTQGTERLADMWLTESLLDRLAKSSTGEKIFQSTNNMLYETPNAGTRPSSSSSSTN